MTTHHKSKPTVTVSASDDATSGVCLFAPNYDPTESFLILWQSGTIQAVYEPGSPAPTSAVIWSQGGATQQLQQGSFAYNVNEGDYIWIQGPGASCKVQFYYQ